MDLSLQTPVSALTRVGKSTARHLSRLGIKNAGDLLYWFPFRYEDYRAVVAVRDLRDGAMVTVQGQVELIANKRSFRKHTNITEALVSDASGSVRVAWFNQPFIIKNLQAGDKVFLSGKVKSDMLGAQLVSPSYERDTGATIHTARLVPMYPLTAGLTQKQIRFLIKQIIGLADKIPDWVPADILEKFDLPPLSDALTGIHFPADDHDLSQSTDRLKFDELFLLQIKAELARLAKISDRAPQLAFQQAQISAFVKGLPFTLTPSQKLSAWEILQDLARPAPMNRLLSGDVGSGKTVVAAIASYSAVLNNHQAVIMAPTEILAFQHYESVCKMLGDKVSVGLVTGSKLQIKNSKIQINNKLQITNSKKDLLEKISRGEINIIIGTHALLSDKIKFKKLGLVIVDEQHRFGVEQRKLIKEKNHGAHFLSMTATPIPRSLALMIYGDLDLSTITELPAGRKKILTRVVEPAKRDRAYDFIRAQVKQGRQVFVVCPLIDQKLNIKNKKFETDKFEVLNYNYPGSELSEKKSVMSEFEKLSKKIFPDLRVEYLHGKMKPAEKDGVMKRFKDGEIDILISTSVIEVGVDIPNASIMMIEGAECFGLAQLHQFRGRVGRSTHQSYCLLFTQNDSAKSSERLKFFESHHDGFKLAEKDLEMRGPGEVYGVEQSGEMNLRLAKLTDKEIIKKARAGARIVVENLEKYKAVLKKVRDWADSVHLE
ncbi:MAG: ATP-dependent DNA helicase RecG [Candidatus Magasanikbacteria bacterium]